MSICKEIVILLIKGMYSGLFYYVELRECGIMRCRIKWRALYEGLLESKMKHLPPTLTDRTLFKQQNPTFSKIYN